jgi:hypothetical protein
MSDPIQTTRDVASSFHLGTRILPCAKCGGEGRTLASHYGGNDPDVWDAGPCPACEGSGNQTCENCGNHPAVAEWKVQGKPYLICRSCHDEWLEDESDV